MTGIKQKIISLKFTSAYPLVKIADGTQSSVLGNEVVQATPFLNT